MLSVISGLNFVPILLGFLGGLGLFLYGINLMGDSLQALAGDKMKSIIEKLTNNVYKGIFVGIIVTGIIQSSSATTALTIGLIRAGLMTMPQAVGIIMGANIGTTITAFLFSFPAISDYSLLFIGLGAILVFLSKNKKIKIIGEAIMGFGLLFFGMDLMGKGLKEIIKASDEIKNILISFDKHPFMGLFTGVILTGIVQSSSATTGIVQSIVDTGQLTIKGAIPIIFGNNIGTTLTAVIAAIGGSISAKRASLFHVLFNVLGVILFMIILNPFSELMLYLQSITDASNKLTIAYAHFIFNVATTLILMWFVKQIINLLKVLIPGKDLLSEEYNEDMFSEKLIEKSPLLALESAKNSILLMAKIVKNMLDKTYTYAHEHSAKLFEEGMTLETIINSLDRKIHEYLVKVNAHIDQLHSYDISKYLDTIRDLERIGDHCQNLFEVYEYIFENKGSYSQDALNDLEEMFRITISMLEKSIVIIKDNNLKLAYEVINMEKQVDELEKNSRIRHTLRVNEGVCVSGTGIMFVELLSNLERIGDHCCNIAEYTINKDYYLVYDEEGADLKKLNAPLK